MELENQTVNDMKYKRDFLSRNAVGCQGLALFGGYLSYINVNKEA
jgi:hypothetical protein